MATSTHYLSGKVKWAKLRTPDNKFGEDKYKMDFYPDDVEAFAALGLELKQRKDQETGEAFYALSRSRQKLIKNELVNFGPPKVVNGKEPVIDDHTGEVLEYQPLDSNIEIGNGSKVTVRLSVYDTMKGKGHRLESVRVDELVEYVRPKEAF